MIVRPLRLEDISALKSMTNGYEYVDPLDEHNEAVLVVESDGRILMACAAHRIVELYLWAGEAPATVKLRALEMLHESMAQELRQKDYHEVEVFLPPQIAKTFGRRLERTFGWLKNPWQNWFRRF